jgi:type IV pilus assembly protein PilB
MAAPPRKRIGELLVEAGAIDEHQLRAALGHQRQWGGKLGQALVDLKLVTEAQIVAALSRKLGFEAVKLDDLTLTPEREAALKLVPGDVARKHNLLPLAADLHTLTIAMGDPTNLAVTDELAFRTRKRIKIALAGDREVARAVLRFYFPDEEEREVEALELDVSDSSVALNNSHQALPEHVQRQFFSAAPAAAPAPPTAVAAPPLPGTVAPVGPPARSTQLDRGQLAPPPRAAAVPEPSAASREAALRDALDRLAAGEEAPGGLRGSRLVGALARALVRRGLVTEAELVAELAQPRR